MSQVLDANAAQRSGIADYTFVRPLGEGNHGAFYLAVPPPRLGTEHERVAVKVLAGSIDGEALRRLTVELQAFTAVSSPNLVSLLDAGQEGTTCYYAMPFYGGGSLASPAQPLSRTEILRAVAGAARGAHALHEAGMVHRDIKPENILFSPDGAKLSDLGLAQVLEPGQTVTNVGPIGSVEYMDPAIIRGGRASRATDIWSLGATLHRALTGLSIYGDIPTDRGPVALLRHVLKTNPQIDTRLGEADVDVVRSCLAAEPAQRPATALMLAEQLEALAAGG